MDVQHEIPASSLPHPWKDFDGFQAVLLVGLAVLLLPAWQVILGESIGVGNLLAGAYLPASLGFLLALRCGVVDLSVWAVMGAASLIAAGIINAFSMTGLATESTPAWVLPAVMAAVVAFGVIVGGLNAAAIHYLPRLGVVVTAIIGLAVLGGTHLFVSSPGVAIPQNAFDPWVSGMNHLLFGAGDGEQAPLPGPLILLRMFVVFLAWTAVLVVLMSLDSAERKQPHPRPRTWTRFASLCASGGLAGLSGVCWLIDAGQAPLPTRLVDELTIPVSAILAGALMFRGPGRTKLAIISLPPAMLLVNVWELMVWPIAYRGYSVSLVMLGTFAWLAQRSFVAGHSRLGCRRWLAYLAMLLAAAGIALMSLWVWFGPAERTGMLHIALAAGGAGALMLAITHRRTRC